MAGHGVVLENGRVRLTGTGTEVLEHPEIGALYLRRPAGDRASTGPDGARAGGVILDCHCHIIPAGMLTDAVPDDWRPVLRRQDGRQVVSFRGRPLTSVTGEFCDVGVMLGAGGGRRGDPPAALAVDPADAGAGGPGDRRQDLPGAERQPGRGRRRSPAAGSTRSARCRCRTPGCAAAELEYLMQLPGMRGVEVPASVGGQLSRRRQVRAVLGGAAATWRGRVRAPDHHRPRPARADGHYLWNSVGNPLETAIAAAQLLTAGVLERHPGLTVLLAHGGGALLALRGRLRRAYAVRPEARSGGTGDPDELLRRLYFDSLTHDQAVLADLVAFAGAGHVLLGSDRPFDMGADQPVQDIRALGLSQADEQLLLGGNASRLLPPAD